MNNKTGIMNRTNSAQSVRRWALAALAVLAALFFSLSLWIDNRTNAGITDARVKEIEKSLHRLQRETHNAVHSAFAGTVDSLCPDFDKLWNADKMRSKGVSLYVVEKDSSTFEYWSDNLPASVERLNKIAGEAKYVKLGNGWYLAQMFDFGRHKAIALILIQTEYDAENRFLQNGFNSVLGFPVNTIVMPLGTDVGVAVRDIAGDPVFLANTDVSANRSFTISALFRWAAIFTLICFLMPLLCNRRLYRRSLWYILPAFALLAALRLFIFFNPAYFKGDLHLFSSMLYADSSVLPSLGDLILHLLFVFLFTVVLFYVPRLSKSVISTAVWTVTTAVFACTAYYIINSLAINSNISFKMYRMNDMTIFTFVSYLIVAALYVELFLLLWLQRMIGGGSKTRRYLIQISVFAAIFVPFSAFSPDSFVFMLVFAALCGLVFRHFRRTKLTLNLIVWLTVLFACYTSFSFMLNDSRREMQKRRLLAQNLASERDPVAEMLLYELENKIASDPYLQDILLSGRYPNIDLQGRLTEQYFRGYFQRYDVRYNICDPSTVLHVPEDDSELNCMEFFRRECDAQGLPIAGCERFMFMTSYWGRIHYYGRFAFAGKDEPADSVNLYIRLYLKRDIEFTGYPELLQFDSKSGQDKDLSGYSYAKYFDGRLVSRFGAYEYGVELNPQTGARSHSFFNRDGYNHYVHTADEHNAIIVSVQRLRFANVASMFSYSFVFMFIALPVLLLLCGLRFDFSLRRVSYRWRISIVMLGGITVALTSLTVSMLAYVISQSDRKNIESIHEKMQSIIIELDRNFYSRELSSSAEMRKELDNLLIGLSNAFYTDMNLYDMNGRLIASSRNEIFEKKLLGVEMNREAFHKIAIEKYPKFIHREQIGKMNYHSTYATYYNRDGEPVACLNLPYFFKQSEFRNELLSLTGAIINIYIFLILAGAALSMFVSNQITRPLDAVRRKMGRIDLAHQPEPIEYKGNNELGDLVREYNRMIAELAESARKLAENERESAWREMARQIAHEIKNPLTPMKLSIQHALRMKEQGREGWQEKLAETVRSILEQIDVLAQTASEFSGFARTGKAEIARIEVEQVLTSSIALFSGYNNTSAGTGIIGYTSHEASGASCFVLANREQLQRVFTNLIKNAIQASESCDSPSIEISLSRDGDEYLIRVIDNGHGVTADAQKNLFKPNFTTRSGGTGLGLAISKSIVESFGGRIDFVPQDAGACFEVRLPIN